jgi:hypothetical protein
MGNKEHGLDECSTVEGESSSKILNTATKSQSYTHTRQCGKLLVARQTAT